MNVQTRITRQFNKLKNEGRKGLVVFITSGDPNYDTSMEILNGLSEAGADFIELGMPFSDPMADGPAIQESSHRALTNGMTLRKTLQMVEKFRLNNKTTPMILMGYFNPIYTYGVDAFLHDAVKAGVDGLIMVDLPPEEETELCLPAIEKGLNFIFLTTPTSTNSRLSRILVNASGFLYYVSITGVTGTRSAATIDIEQHLGRIRKKTDLPVAVGFGISNSEQVKAVASIADAVVVGSAVVNVIKENLDKDKCPKEGLIDKVHTFVSSLSESLNNV